MKSYKFEDSDPVTMIYFLELFKRAFDSNGVSKDVAIWFLLFCMAKFPTASPTIQMTSWKESRDYFDGPRRVDGQQSIFVDVKAISYLLNSYKINYLNVRAAAKL